MFDRCVSFRWFLGNVRLEKGEFYQYRTLYYIQSNHKDVTNRRITVKVLSRVDIEEIAERILNEYRKLPEIKNRELINNEITINLLLKNSKIVTLYSTYQYKEFF